MSNNDGDALDNSLSAIALYQFNQRNLKLSRSVWNSTLLTQNVFRLNMQLQCSNQNGNANNNLSSFAFLRLCRLFHVVVLQESLKSQEASVALGRTLNLLGAFQTSPLCIIT